MRVSISTPGRFWSFDLAAQLHRFGVLSQIFSGYPRFKLKGEAVPSEKIVSIWPLHTAYLASLRLPFQRPLAPLQERLAALAQDHMDRTVRRLLGDADLLVALSGSGLLSGLEMQRRGGHYVCDRGSSHIRFQDRILREEADILGLPWRGIDDHFIEKELAEYSVSNAIFVPSDFVRRTFIEEGVAADKVRMVPYGVNLTTFQPNGHPAGPFRVLFAGALSFRKGVHYLLRAWNRWRGHNAELHLAGSRTPEFDHLVAWGGGLPKNVTLLGHLNREQVVREMSTAHVLALPSLEEGLALAQAQAMACGAAVIATEHTGAATLFEHGKEGLIGPIRSVEFLCEAFERLATDRQALESMRAMAGQRARTFGDANAYGQRALAALEVVQRGAMSPREDALGRAS